MNELTPRQGEVLNAIKDYKARVGFPPTIFELVGLIGCSSPNAAAAHVTALKKKGYITVAPGVARGITILEEDEGSDAITIVRALLDGADGARDEAIAWLEAKEAAL
ncbi:LexA family transcriptional regulator [Kluyvera ascorbata]|uniref:LexA family protein n=1 Tax=Kluyvera ascorbata TaxID=51288 RepID=UPI0034D715CF